MTPRTGITGRAERARVRTLAGSFFAIIDRPLFCNADGGEERTAGFLRIRAGRWSFRFEERMPASMTAACDSAKGQLSRDGISIAGRRWSMSQFSAGPNCDTCEQPMSFMALIERLGTTPAQCIFECVSCRALKWIAEELGTD